MKQFMKSTTSLSLIIALSLPGTGFAQSSNLPSCNAEGGQREYPCALWNGEVATSFVDLLEKREARQRAAVAEATTEVGVAEGKQMSNADIENAKAALAEAEAKLADTQQRLAAAREEAAQPKAEAPKTESTGKLVMDTDAKQGDKAAKARKQERLAAEQAEREALREAKRKERRKAKREAAAAAAAAAEEESAKVFEERLDKQDVRSSDEEFDTKVTGNEAAPDDGGLSKFEKALLLGLGAVAVGTVLKNGDKVVNRSGDRVVVERDGELRVLKDDNALLRQPGNEVRTETFSDGSTRSTVTKPDGTKIVTIRSADGTVLRRVRVATDGTQYVLFDDTVEERDIVVSELPQIRATNRQAGLTGEDELRAALIAQQADAAAQRFSLRQVRDINRVRALAPEIELDAVRFDTGSAAIRPEQARSLARIGNALRNIIDEDPRTVILVEGHTDAVGDETYNLALSDRRAETVALALTEYFDVPPENMVTQGYGESSLKVPTLDAEPANRRAVVRNITELLR